MPAETHVEQGPIDRQRDLRARSATAWPTSSRSTHQASAEGQSFVDDLEADSLALIELVEALEEELGERTVGFRIEDEDLEDLKTVRDAVDYVVRQGEVSPDALDPDLEALGASASATTFQDPALLRQALGAPVVVRGVPRATPRTSAWSSWATPCSAGSWPTSSTARYGTSPEGSSPSSARRS